MKYSATWCACLRSHINQELLVKGNSIDSGQHKQKGGGWGKEHELTQHLDEQQLGCEIIILPDGLADPILGKAPMSTWTPIADP